MGVELLHSLQCQIAAESFCVLSLDSDIMSVAALVVATTPTGYCFILYPEEHVFENKS